MTMKMDDFLLEYFRRLHFSKMPPEQFSTFCDIVQQKDFTGNMKKWQDLLENTTTRGATGFPIKKLPNPTVELTDDDWKKLYTIFNNAFREMDQHRDSMESSSKALKFLDEYFGISRPFSHPIAGKDAEQEIEELYTYLSDPEVKEELESYISGIADNMEYDKFVQGLQEKKYNTDPKFKNKMVAVANHLMSDTRWFEDEQKAKLKINKPFNFTAITNSDKYSEIDTNQLDDFKKELEPMLQKLYSEEEVFTEFSARDNGKISGQLKKARDGMQYDKSDSKDYVEPKREDKLTLAEQISKFFNKTYTEHLDKYLTLRGDQVFDSEQAKNICEAINSEKIKKTDGLNKFLESADKVKKGFRNKNNANSTAKHFDWMVKTLNELKADPKLKSVFAGALKNGAQMKLIAEELILKALASEPPKEAEAKTAMEVLSTMRYGLLSSQVMDAFNKSDFSIFSDKNLSWNKNAGVQFVTNAMDKTLKFAFGAIGYTLTAAGNLIRSQGDKFNGKSDRLGNIIQDENNKRNVLQGNLGADDTRYQTEIDTLSHQHGIDPDAIPASDPALDAEKNNKENEISELEEQLRNAKASKQSMDQYLDPVNQRIAGYDQKIGDLQQEIDTFNSHEKEIADLQAELAQRQAFVQTKPEDEQALYAESLAQLAGDILKKELAHSKQKAARPNLIDENDTEIQFFESEKARVRSEHQTEFDMQRDNEAEIQRLQDELAQKRAELAQANQKIDEFKKATERIKYLQDRKASLAKQVEELKKNGKDIVYARLMAYWDDLSGGRMSHMNRRFKYSPLSRSTHQKNYAKNSENERNMFAKKYLQEHFGMAV